jgi:hypothetical protein
MLANRTHRITILKYVREQIDQGQTFFKARYIGKVIGLNSHVVGVNLGLARGEETDLDIVHHASGANGTTWRIEYRMKDICKGCDQKSSDCQKDKPKCGKDMVFCDSCDAGFEWDKVPDSNVKIVYESRGEFWGAPCSEPVCYGWTCACGHYNEL